MRCGYWQLWASGVCRVNYDEWVRLGLTFDDWLAIGRANKYCNESKTEGEWVIPARQVGVVA